MIVLRNKYFGPGGIKSFEALAEQFYRKAPKKKVIPKPDPRWPWTNL